MDNIDGETFGERLCKLRKLKGLSQKEIADFLGYKHNASISNIEANRTPPDIDSLCKLAKILDADLHWLITGWRNPVNATIRSNYLKALSLLHTQLHYGIQHVAKTIEDFQKIVDDIEQKQKAGKELTDAEKEDLKFYKPHIPFQQSILDGYLADQAWAAKAMNDVLSTKYTGQEK
jgi:transcriptional regulator with XRE-family HTH domain